MMQINSHRETTSIWAFTGGINEGKISAGSRRRLLSHTGNLPLTLANKFRVISATSPPMHPVWLGHYSTQRALADGSAPVSELNVVQKLSASSGSKEINLFIAMVCALISPLPPHPLYPTPSLLSFSFMHTHYYPTRSVEKLLKTFRLFLKRDA